MNPVGVDPSFKVEFLQKTGKPWI